MKYRGPLKAWAFAAALAAGALGVPAVGAEPLRACADPDNLPFTKSEGPERGMYLELVELIGQRLDMPIEYTWWYTYYQRRMLRNTVAADRCDLLVSLPSDYKARAVVKTRPFLEVGYALVSAPGFTFKALEDLKARRIGVQFGTTPQLVLASREGYQTTTYRNADEIFAALEAREIDVAFLWGPSAGYENQRKHGGRWAVAPVSGLELGGSVSMGVARARADLVARIDAALAELKPQIEQLAQKYGFPRGKPVELSTAGAPTSRVVSVPASWVASVQAKGEADVSAGRVRFNNVCSHCHGTDGASPIRERDLRRLKSRYDDRWLDTALTTIRNGRPDKGMPTWKDALKDDEIQEVVAFLKTVQK